MTTKVDARLNSYSPAVLSLFRVVFGFLFFLFGTSHLFDWPIPFGIPTGSCRCGTPASSNWSPAC